MIKSRKHMRVTILIISMLIFSIATVYVSGDNLDDNSVTQNPLEKLGVSNANDNTIMLPEQSLNTEDTYIRDLISETKKSKTELEQLKAKLGSWEDVKIKLAADIYLNEVEKNRLSENKISELHQKGYIVRDILIAQSLAPLCERPVEELLAAKGRSDRYGYKNIKDNDGNEKKAIVRIEGKTWDMVLAEFGVNPERLEKTLGISAASLDNIKQDMNITDVIDIALQSAYMDKGFSTFITTEVEQKEKNGLLQRTNQDKQVNAEDNKLIIKAKPEPDPEVELEEHLIRTYRITEAEIALCKQNNINDIRDIAYSKSLIVKYNVTFEQIFKLKNDKGSWEEVVEELGGNR